MARTALKVKTLNRQKKAASQRAANLPITNSTKVYNRCKNCGKVKGYMRKFVICRICFRELASNGKIMGVKKSSW